MQTTRGTHRYTESGLSNVTLLNVDTRSCPECGEREVVIPKITKLHELIARALIQDASPLTPEEVRFLRKWLGYSSADFALYMGVRPETVSRWENPAAAYPLSATADRLLRLLVANQGPVEKYPIDLFKNPSRSKAAPIKLRAPDWKKAASS
jgi:putative zinc finger/helix-turn-helix YgiT family protein